NKDFVVYCDASHKGLGAILMQREKDKPLRVRALVMTISLNLPKQILEAQIKALKLENLEKEDVGSIIRTNIPKERLETRVDGTLCLHGKSWLPCYGDLRSVIMHESNKSNVLILALPEGNKDFVVYCDASHKGLGAILMQREKVITYASR
nr:reverse transcriptase domain-containing protein [Tanacetum cinerariifolium]